MSSTASIFTGANYAQYPEHHKKWLALNFVCNDYLKDLTNPESSKYGRTVDVTLDDSNHIIDLRA
jgi:hypothetical protein